MIFREHNGKLIEINKMDFNNDKLYYNKIIQTINSESNISNLYSNSTYNYNNYSINNLINLHLNIKNKL
jgi:hypothetical protein